MTSPGDDKALGMDDRSSSGDEELSSQISQAANAESIGLAVGAGALAEEQAFAGQDSDLDDVMARAQVRHAQAKAAAYEADTWMKTWLAPKVFSFMQCWCLFVGLIFCFYFLLKKGDIPSEVMIALLTTTTVSIVGLVGFLVQGLFKSVSRNASDE